MRTNTVMIEHTYHGTRQNGSQNQRRMVLLVAQDQTTLHIKQAVTIKQYATSPSTSGQAMPVGYSTHVAAKS